MMKFAAALCLSVLLFLPAAAGWQEDSLCRDIKKPFFRSAAMRDGRKEVLPARAGSAAAAFVMPKPAGVKRIFVVGESAAQLLGTSGGGGGTEIINCGMGGYDSSRVEAVFRETLGYEPDLVVVLSGNNEGREYPCPGLGPELRRRRIRLLERLYSLRSSGIPAAVGVSLETQEKRLDAMAALAAKKKVPLLLCTLPANLELPPPGALPLESGLFAKGLYLFENKNYEEAANYFSERLAETDGDLHARFYLGRALAASGRKGEALAQYLAVEELDPAQGRTSAARNRMIKAAAARGGAGVCDLEKAFVAASPGALPGFALFSDGVHWRGPGDGLAWREIAAAAGSMGLTFVHAPPAAAVPPVSAEELKKIFSYAVSGMDDAAAYGADRETLRAGFISEPSLAEMAFMEAARPGLPEKLAMSGPEFSEYFIVNAWSSELGGRLDALRSVFTAYLAELERRRGNNKKALDLIERAIAGNPEKVFYRLVKAEALYGLGRKKEAAAEFGLLQAIPALKEKAGAAALARGLALPAWAASPAADEENRAASKKLSDEGVALARSGNAAGAEALLARAVAAYPANAEARFSLCALKFMVKDYKAALEECSLVAPAAASYPLSLRAGITADGLYLRGRALAELNSPGAGAESVRAALAAAPASWERRAEAQALLEKLGR